MKKSEILKKIKELEDRLERKGEYRVSCSNLGRGITDSILLDMEKIEIEIKGLRRSL